jgi:hypothetical protein
MIDTTICFECGTGEYIQQHHVVPRSLGGTKTIPLCDSCHAKVHGRDFIHRDPVHWRELIRQGRERYVENGGKFGRPHGTYEDYDVFINKPKNKAIISLLEQGLSVRKIAKEVNCSTSTVCKVNAAVFPKDP